MAEPAATSDVRTGGCRCGAVRFRVAGNPIWVAHCHCKDCRRSTGAPFVTWSGFAPAAFRWEGVAPQDYASSPGVVRSFCPRCGTPLAFSGARWPNEIHLLVGTFDDPASLEPRGHVYVQDQMPWIKLADGLKRFAKTGKDGPPLP
jgi:hypothetical protein